MLQYPRGEKTLPLAKLRGDMQQVVVRWSNVVAFVLFCLFVAGYVVEKMRERHGCQEKRQAELQGGVSRLRKKKVIAPSGRGGRGRGMHRRFV